MGYLAFTQKTARTNLASEQNFSERLNSLLSHGKKGKLAEFCGVEASTVSRWLSGQTAPTGESCFKIAEFLGVDAKWLISGETEKRSANPNEPGDANPAHTVLREIPTRPKHSPKVELHTHLRMVNKVLADMHGDDEIIHGDIVAEDLQVYGKKPLEPEPTLADVFALLKRAIELLEVIAIQKK